MTAVLLVPGPLISKAGQEGWLAVFTGAFLGLVPTLTSVYVAVRHPGQGPAQIAQIVLGKWLGRLVGAVYAAFALWIYSLVLRDLYDFMTSVLMTRTPGVVLVASMAAVVLYGIWGGLEPLARVAFQVVTAVGTGVVLLMLLSSREYNILQREPFLFQGLGAVLESTWETATWFSEGVIAMWLVAHVKQPRQAFRWTLIAYLCAALTLAGITLTISLVLGPNLPSRLLYPTFSLSEIISLGAAVERLEVLLVIVWTSGIFIMLGVYLLATSTAAAHTLGLKSHRVTAVVLTLAGVWIVGLWPSSLDVAEFSGAPLRLLVHGGTLVFIPLVLLVGTLVHGALQRRRSASA
ncbi:MAG: gerKB2 [Symbiobacteriaceae bacterium]|jgi:spore germination protein KB|nr:gerKB2 [Symbiobacteriaceae bacterium]